MSPGVSKRLAALVSLLLFIALAVVLVQAVYRNSLSLVIGLPSLAIAVGGAWWVITEVSPRRGVGAVALALGLVLVVVAIWRALTHAERTFWQTLLLIGVMALALALARYSLKRPPSGSIVTTRPQRPDHPVLLCNPWSGGGKVEQFGLVDLARDMDVEVVLLDRGLDLEQLTRDAVARGADCLGMAGGDGSQALVASVAIEHDLPFVCIPAGTRNHFALDLGLDRIDPRKAMAAFKGEEERRVDYGTVNGRLFVNNVSLGIYATIVQSDEYRDAKVEVSRSMVTDLLGRQSEPFDLQYAPPGEAEIDGAFLIMVSNNQYVLGARRDVAQRRRLDAGELGVFAVSTRTGENAARLITLSAIGLRNLSPHWFEFTAQDFEVRSRSGTIYAGIDGEALELDSPLQFEIYPDGLKLFVPKGNLEIAEKRRARDVRFKDVLAVAAGREAGMPA